MSDRNVGAFGRRLLLLVDAKSYGSADVPLQREYQEAIPRLLDQAAEVADLEPDRWLRQANGDSQFAVLPEDASEPALVDRFMRELEGALRTFNRNRVPTAWLRLRAAVHFGTASRGANGFVGHGPVQVSRICDSKVLRAALDAASEACLAVGLSATVFNDVVAQAYTTIRVEEFHEVEVAEKEYRGRIWIWVPGHDVHSLDLGGAAGGDSPAGPHPQPSGGGPPPAATVVTMTFEGDVHAERGIFGIAM